MPRADSTSEEHGTGPGAASGGCLPPKRAVVSGVPATAIKVLGTHWPLLLPISTKLQHPGIQAWTLDTAGLGLSHCWGAWGQKGHVLSLPSTCCPRGVLWA